MDLNRPESTSYPYDLNKLKIGRSCFTYDLVKLYEKGEQHERTLKTETRTLLSLEEPWDVTTDESDEEQ